MTLDGVWADFIAGNKIRRTSWIDPPDITEAYIRLEIPPGATKKSIVRYSGSNKIARVVQMSLGAGDLLASDWELV